MTKNPFGDDAEREAAPSPFEDDAPDERLDPFGDALSDDPVGDGANRMEHAARKIRMLKSRLGGEGLTPSATRELLVELGKALDAAARALRTLGKENRP